MKLEFVKLTDTASAPTFAHVGDACFDLRADVREPLFIRPGETALIHTGLAFNTPVGWKILVHSRSGHAVKNSIRLANCTGIVDAGYRGEVIVALHNDHPFDSFTVNPDDRIAQAALERVEPVTLVEASVLDSTERGANGFGSTGVQ